MDEFLSFVARNPVLFTLFGVVTLLLIANELHGILRGGKRLTPTEAVRLSNDRDAQFIDVRSPADFKRGHVIGAVNVPSAKLDEHKKVLDKVKTKPVIVYCALGGTAPAVVEKLRQRGFEEAYAMRGGVNAWQGAGLPIRTPSS